MLLATALRRYFRNNIVILILDEFSFENIISSQVQMECVQVTVAMVT